MFNAKELDNETGLYYYGARYLDPTGAMWLSVDPVFHAGTSPYAYCLGNPVKMVDPDGRVECDENGTVNVDFEADHVNSLLQQRLQDPNISGTLRRTYITGISSVDSEGNITNVNESPTYTNYGIMYQFGIARTDSRDDGKGGNVGGREFLVIVPIRSVDEDVSITDDLRSNCFGLSLLGGQMGILNGYEANIVIEDEFSKIATADAPAYIKSGGVALWGNRDGYHHAARYIGTPEPNKRHGFIFKNNFDGDINEVLKGPLNWDFYDLSKYASCSYEGKEGYFVRYFNPNNNRTSPRSVK